VFRWCSQCDLAWSTRGSSPISEGFPGLLHLPFSFFPFFPLVNNQQKFSNFTTRTGLTELSCLEGIIFFQSIMPQLDKFTYFTQFFWLCLFFFTFYIVKKLLFHLEGRVYFFYVMNARFQQIVFCFELILFFFLCFRGSSLLYHNLKMVLFQNTIFGISPFEMDLLNHYLNQPNQDPEWLKYVRDCLGTTSPYLRQYDIMVRNFLDYYNCETTREQITQIYQIIYYGREAPQFLIEPIDLDGIIRVYLEKWEFNQAALTEVLSSLIQERENSPFYTEVKTTEAHHFQGFLNLRKKAQLDLLQRNKILKDYKALENRIQFLQSQNASLKDRL
jgi:hypothetical protein